MAGWLKRLHVIWWERRKGTMWIFEAEGRDWPGRCPGVNIHLAFWGWYDDLYFWPFLLVSGPIMASLSWSWFSSFHHPTFTPRYPRAPHVPSRNTSDQEHCHRLTSPITFFHCCPIASCHIGSDFLRVVASPETPQRSETQSESLVSLHSLPSPHRSTGPPVQGLRIWEESSGPTRLPCLPVPFAFFIQPLGLNTACFPHLDIPSWWHRINLQDLFHQVWHSIY